MIWDHFEEDVMEPEKDICNYCGAKIARGAPKSQQKTWSTKSLWGHLEAKHKEYHETAKSSKADLEKEK